MSSQTPSQPQKTNLRDLFHYFTRKDSTLGLYSRLYYLISWNRYQRAHPGTTQAEWRQSMQARETIMEKEMLWIKKAGVHNTKELQKVFTEPGYIPRILTMTDMHHEVDELHAQQEKEEQ